MNYGLIKETFDNLMLKSLEKKDTKTIKKLKNEISGNRNFRALYYLIENLQSGEVSSDVIDQYIYENIEMAKKYNFKEFDRTVRQLSKVGNKESLVRHIGAILFEKKTPLNLSSWQDSYSIVRKNLLENNSKNKPQLKEKVNELESLIKGIDEEDKVLFETLLKNTDDSEKIYENIINDCIVKLDAKVKILGEDNEDLALKVSLLEVKDKLRTSKYDEENFVKKIIEIHSLKKELIK